MDAAVPSNMPYTMHDIGSGISYQTYNVDESPNEDA